MKVTVLDMQQIEPATGGGRLRLLGLYHALGPDIEVTYVGTYDHRGPGRRRHQLSPTMVELNVPLSEAHFQACDDLAATMGGFNTIDLMFAQQAHLSRGYVDAARNAAAKADVVVFSHPWIYPLVKDALDPTSQLIVYESHNVEALLRGRLLNGVPNGEAVLRCVVETERELCEAANLILACSQTDRLQFRELYDVEIDKIRIAPNGVFFRKIGPAGQPEKISLRRSMKLPEKPTAIFLGSLYGPNLEAAMFIANDLARQLPEVSFVIAGGVGTGVEKALGKKIAKNVKITGQIPDDDRDDYLRASDIALNPMNGGSGTNIKMFDFMAAGLAIVTTPIGARGIETGQPAFVSCECAAFATEIRTLIDKPEEREQLGKNARSEVERHYGWETISPKLGLLLSRRFDQKIGGKPTPKFSVVIPAYERPKSLTRLLDLLALQSETDFEVIVIDQSREAWEGQDLRFGFDLAYIRSPIKGAVSARNLGAQIAQGEIIAFIDDDCEPTLEWLKSARLIFDENDVVGVEGLIESSKQDDDAWRAVTNRGNEGLGFMTANMFVRASAFHTLNGFDVAFENPHFREDTDLGWRLQTLGRVPFSADAWIYHPPHRRDLDRESHWTRVAFFEKDAVLMQKHPKKYQQLLQAEGHWKTTTGFWTHFLRGAKKYNVVIPEKILKLQIQET